MAVRVAINGFGRTGRAALRSAVEPHRKGTVTVVAINDLASPEVSARLLQRDSVHGRFPGEIDVCGHGELVVAGQTIRFFSSPDVEGLPWKELDVDVVLEATGRHTSRADTGRARHSGGQASDHHRTRPRRRRDLRSGRKRRHLRPGKARRGVQCVLHHKLPGSHGQSARRRPGHRRGTDVDSAHAYTGGQCLVDAVHKDPRRSRAAALNIVPTTTGAARATGLVLGSVNGHLDGLALRVPVPDGSVTDLVALVGRAGSAEDVNAAFARRLPAQDRSRPCSTTKTSRLSPPTSWDRPHHAYSIPGSPWSAAAWSRCSGGTTTRRDMPVGSSTWRCEWALPPRRLRWMS